MPNFCPNCAAPLDADARFCPSCRASVGVATALASELTGSLKAGVRSAVAEAGHGVPPFIWAAALQIYWLLNGIGGMILGGLLLGVGMGVLSAASAVSGLMGAGTGTGGAEMERVLLFGFLSFLAGAVDTCLSTVLVYGFLTLRKWAYGVFVVWLPVKVVLAIIAYLSTPSFGKTADTKPFIIIFVTALTVILNIAALVVEFILVRRGNTALAEE